jgi:hypothetical protein
MKRHSLHRFVALAAVLFLPAMAQAQVVGSITGTVTDQTGVPLRGVKVSARSDTQIGGAKAVYTNDEGFFRIAGLQPGIFELTTSAPKLKSVVQKQIRVGLNAAAQVDVLMEAETAVEEVKVIERAPVVSTTSAKVKETFDSDFVDSIPLDKRTGYGGFIRDNVPGAADGGGVFAAQDWLARVRGANANQNSILVEGFYMNWQKITLNSLAAMEVLTAGNGAENAGTPGAVVNMVTQSGSNRYLLDVTAWHEDGSLRLFTSKGDPNNDRRQSFFNPAISGPILKDKLWFYLNVETRNELIHRDPDPTGVVDTPPPRYYWNVRGTMKLTWQVTPRNKIQSFTLINRESWNNVLEGYGSLDKDAQSLQDWQDYFTGITWESLLADNVFFKSQVGWQRFLRQQRPESCYDDESTCYDIMPKAQIFPRTVNFGNYDKINQLDDRSLELVNTLDWYVQTRRLGEHSVKLASRFAYRIYETTDGVPTSGKQLYNGDLPYSRIDYYSNDPRLEEARRGLWIRASNGFRLTNSISDIVRVTRYFSVTPGVALTVNRAGTTVNDDVINQLAVTPHLSAGWDMTHDGRTVLRGSYNHYVDTYAVPIARAAMGDGVSKECKWSATTGTYETDCKYSGGVSGRTVGLPCGPQGFTPEGQPCNTKLKTPRTIEYTLGLEREIVPGIGLGADLVHRVFVNQYERAETNRVWNPSGSALSGIGSYRNGRAQTVDDLETPDEASRRYTGITFSLKKREGAVKMTASYTWSRLEGNVFLEEDNEFGDIPARNGYLWGPSPYDRRHELRASAAWQVNKWFSTGLFYNYYSGAPYSRKFFNSETSKYEDYRARVGIDPGTNINDPIDDRPLRLPDIQKLNLQLRANLKPLLKINLEVFTDIINVLGLRTATAVYVENGPSFGQPSAILDPLRVRLGMRFRY